MERACSSKGQERVLGCEKIREKLGKFRKDFLEEMGDNHALETSSAMVSQVGR